ncbi:hypothetical protein D8Y22_08925 [Salinadaptatus halalkaliphilus]|uniref:Uncharacterized protein n=1 Tax=Salinadaptatus halalkaliphilus TaxID=2419781 RepID=A0A4S3TM62_9EURY|nr:hypothetical protein [Salinadaptatus halalkaliphilus]THE65304.1 hypothetical protein D8Y22_08925 [Salinadaptatus halalkaliphilus]
MSEPTSTNEQRNAPDHHVSALSPPVRTIAVESIPPQDRSLSVSLCRVAGEFGSAADSSPRRTDRILEPVTDAVAVFEGYVRIRCELLTGDRYDRPGSRDVAVLASDSLHATAYTMVADAPIADRRILDLYRVLTEGSSTVSGAFQGRSSDDGEPTGIVTPRPATVLAGIAADLGATAVGVPAEQRTALTRYSRSLVAALTLHPSPTDALTETVVHLLEGRDESHATVDRERATTDGTPVETTSIETHLERARTALSSLEVVDRNDRRDGVQSPSARLERATRIPFEDVVADDG